MKFSGKTPTAKRRSIAKTLIAQLNSASDARSPILIGSASYGAANEESDVDLIALSPSKRPFKAFVPVQHPVTDELVKVSISGFPVDSDSLKYSNRTSISLTEVLQNRGFWAIGIPNVLRDPHEFALLASTGVIDQVRCAAKDLSSKGVSTTTPDELTENIIRAMGSRDGRLYEKGRLKRGLRRIMVKNVADAINLLPFFTPVRGDKNREFLPVRPNKKYVIGSSINDLKLSPPPSAQQMCDWLEDRHFRKEVVYPILNKTLASKSIPLRYGELGTPLFSRPSAKA